MSEGSHLHLLPSVGQPDQASDTPQFNNVSETRVIIALLEGGKVSAEIVDACTRYLIAKRYPQSAIIGQGVDCQIQTSEGPRSIMEAALIELRADLQRLLVKAAPRIMR